jgi:hypothetical protein
VTFDLALFESLTAQLRGFGEDYAALGLDATEAACWARHGFLPHEAKPWIDAGFSADDACGWANRYIGPADAARKAAAGQRGRISGTPCPFEAANRPANYPNYPAGWAGRYV